MELLSIQAPYRRGNGGGLGMNWKWGQGGGVQGDCSDLSGCRVWPGYSVSERCPDGGTDGAGELLALRLRVEMWARETNQGAPGAWAEAVALRMNKLAWGRVWGLASDWWGGGMDLQKGLARQDTL